MNEHSLEQLLHEAPEPPMHVDLDHILHQGRTRQRRHRITALSALAATLILAIAATLGIQGRDTTTPTPAHHTTTQTSGFFTPDRGLGASQAFNRAFGKQSMWTTKQVLRVVRTDGQLSVRRPGTRAALPIGSSINGVLGQASIVENGKGSILLTPVPADTTSIEVDSTAVGSSSSQGVTLPDGTHVALVFTGDRITTDTVRGWFWGTSDSGYEYSTGQRASIASLGSIHTFYFPAQKILGLSTAGGTPMNWGRAPVGQFLSRGENTTGKGPHMRWNYVALLPRNAHGIHAELPSSYHSQWTPALRHANLPGTDFQVVGMSLTSRNDHPAGDPTIRWVDHRGAAHSIR